MTTQRAPGYEAYQKYIASAAWRKKRRAFLKFGGLGQCERCGGWFAGRDINVHHKHYQTLGHEARGDVEVVCVTCHARADRERAARGRTRGEAALWAARLDGWASKVYGDDWRDMRDPEDVEAEFSDWLEEQERMPC